MRNEPFDTRTITQPRHSRIQIWEIGAVVHVGFLTLQVYGREPDCGGWRLKSLGGAKHYRFVPHHGLQRIDRFRHDRPAARTLQ